METKPYKWWVVSDIYKVITVYSAWLRDNNIEKVNMRFFLQKDGQHAVYLHSSMDKRLQTLFNALPNCMCVPMSKNPWDTDVSSCDVYRRNPLRNQHHLPR